MAKPTEVDPEDISFTLALMALLHEEGLTVDDFFDCIKPPQFTVYTPLTRFSVQFKDGTVFVFDTSIAASYTSEDRDKRIARFMLADPELATNMAAHIKGYVPNQEVDPSPFTGGSISARLDQAQCNVPK